MNRDYRDYPASIWDAIGDVDQGICCAALGGVVWDFVSHLTPAQLLAAMDSAALETLRAIRDILEDDTLEDPECVQRIDAILSAFYLKLGRRSTAAEFESSRASALCGNESHRARKCAPACLVQGVSLRKKPRRVRARRRESSSDPFSPAACASGKTLLRL